MINIEFKFKHEPKLIRNQYVLTVHYEHGDADGDTSNDHTYSDSAEDLVLLKQDLLGMITFIKMNSEFENAVEDIAPIFEAQGIQDAYQVAEGWSDNFYEGDITCDKQAGAALVGYDLVYYDDSGDRFDVEIFFNGLQVE